jgi:hypothetical protein
MTTSNVGTLLFIAPHNQSAPFSLVTHSVPFSLVTHSAFWLLFCTNFKSSQSQFATNGHSVNHGLEPALELVTRYYFLSECSCLKVFVSSLWGALSDERTRLQFAVQSLNGPCRAEPGTILHCLIWGSSNLEGRVYVFISPRNRDITVGRATCEACVEFGYQLSICSGTKGKGGKPWSSWLVAGPAWRLLTSSPAFYTLALTLILNLIVCILLRVLDQVQGFRLTQHCFNSCLVFYSITATCFGRWISSGYWIKY